MRFLRAFSLFLALAMVVAALTGDGRLALGQTVDDAEEDAADARARTDVADGLVDAAVAERSAIEVELALTIARLNELSAELSTVSSELDTLKSQIGFADIELVGIEADLEVQAVDAYMRALSAPGMTFVNTDNVEKLIVAGRVVDDVINAGREAVDDLVMRKRDLEQLRADFLERQERVTVLREDVDNEMQHLEMLYEEADSAVADAIRAANEADAAYRAALSDVESARARDAERERQAEREPATTTAPPPESGTTTTTVTPTTTTTSGGGGGPWNHPPAVEQWRGLVQQYFPANRVEEALRIIDCESHGDPDAYNPYSGASGLFQFLPSTWATTSPAAGFPGASPFEPGPNIGSAAWLANRYQELGLSYWQAWNCRRVLN